MLSARINLISATTIESLFKEINFLIASIGVYLTCFACHCFVAKSRLSQDGVSIPVLLIDSSRTANICPMLYLHNINIDKLVLLSDVDTSFSQRVFLAL